MVNGKYDFRLADPDKLVQAIKRKLCWLCGQSLGVHMTFVIGPIGVINRVTPEPPCHLECADYAARACPFLAQPRMRRNEADMPQRVEPGGIMIKRNPGVCVLWTTRSYKAMRDGNGVLFQIGDPEHVEWFAEGRKAKRDEVDESFRTGLPALEKLAEEDGPEAEQELAKALREAEAFLPAA